jgi:hypothetical protein
MATEQKFKLQKECAFVIVIFATVRLGLSRNTKFVSRKHKLQVMFLVMGIKNLCLCVVYCDFRTYPMSWVPNKALKSMCGHQKQGVESWDGVVIENRIQEFTKQDR